jgi:type II secretory pathway component PulK
MKTHACSIENERGAALLMTLLMLSLLVVIVGQFSYSVVVDYRVAKNYLLDAQLTLNIFAGIETAAAQVSQGNPVAKPAQANQEAPSGIQLLVGDSEVSVALEEEDAKLNVNILLTPPQGVSQDEARQVLARLLKSIEESGAPVSGGLADSIAQYVLDKGSPVLTLRELLNAENVTEEILYGGGEEELDEGFEGLSVYLTVWSDGLIDYNAADDKVLLALVEGMNERTLDNVLSALDSPSGQIPQNMKAIVARVKRFVKAEGSTYSAIVESRSDYYARKCMAVLKRGEGGASLVLWDEMEP